MLLSAVVTGMTTDTPLQTATHDNLGGRGKRSVVDATAARSVLTGLASVCLDKHDRAFGLRLPIYETAGVIYDLIA